MSIKESSMGMAVKEDQWARIHQHSGITASLSSLFSIFSRYLPKYSLEQLTAVSDQRKAVLDRLITAIRSSTDELSFTRNNYKALISEGRLTQFNLFADCSYSPVIKDWLSQDDSFWQEQLHGSIEAFDNGEGDLITRWMMAFQGQYIDESQAKMAADFQDRLFPQ